MDRATHAHGSNGIARVRNVNEPAKGKTLIISGAGAGGLAAASARNAIQLMCAADGKPFQTEMK